MDNEKEDLQRKLNNILSKSNVPAKKTEVSDLEKLTYDAHFWEDPKGAAETLKRISVLKKEIDDVEMMQLLVEENDLTNASKLISQYEILLFLSGPYDRGDAVFSIHAGPDLSGPALFWFYSLLPLSSDTIKGIPSPEDS